MLVQEIMDSNNLKRRIIFYGYIDINDGQNHRKCLKILVGLSIESSVLD